MSVKDAPTPRSYPAILGAMLDKLAQAGIDNPRVGGPLLSILEAAAQADTRQSYDVMRLLAANNLESAEKTALDALAQSEGLTRLAASKATGVVTIQDSSFTKRASRLSSAAPAPIAGAVQIKVESALDWPSTGAIYIGRGTTRPEGPIPYGSITNNGAYWTINLTTPTTATHLSGESVVLAQGGSRVIDVGQVVSTPLDSPGGAIRYRTLSTVTLLDGESEIVDVAIIAQESGQGSNVSTRAIQVFDIAPFLGAKVFNPVPIVSGRDKENDAELRARIRYSRANKQRGTASAIKNALTGVSSRDARIGSVSIVDSDLIIDDGAGAEQSPLGVGLEILTDKAIGGESFFSTTKTPLVQAYLQAQITGPYTILDGAKLSIDVGGSTTTHSFDSSSFVDISVANAYEIAASVNADPTLGWSARTVNGGSSVVFVARSKTNEDIQYIPVVGATMDVGTVLGLQSKRQYTARLYKNDKLLHRDGIEARITSKPFAQWSYFAGAQTLSIKVDSTPVTTYTWIDQDFIDSASGFTTTGKNSLNAWAKAINAKIPGINAIIENDVIILTSNRGRSSDALIQIVGGTLVENFCFDTGMAQGLSNDYSLNTSTGQIKLNKPLEPGEKLSLGTSQVGAFIESPSFSSQNLSVPATTWWGLDSDIEIIPHGITATTPLSCGIATITPESYITRMQATASSELFSRVNFGDWAIIFDQAAPEAMRNAWRVVGKESVAYGDSLISFSNSLLLEHPGRAARNKGALSVLSTGLVLLCGGYTASRQETEGSFRGVATTSSVNLFDASTGVWTTASPMTTPRACHTATTLTNGKVLVVGGYDADGRSLSSTEIYDAITNTWTPGPVMAQGRTEHTATLLANGKVLIAGGRTDASTLVTDSIEYDSTTNTLVNSRNLITPRYGHQAVLMPSTAGAEAGNVLLIGGMVSTTTINSVERYSASGLAWSSKASLGPGGRRAFFGATSLSTANKILVLGDCRTGINQSTYQVYDIGANTWTTPSFVIDSSWTFIDNAGGLVPIDSTTVMAYGGATGTTARTMRHMLYSISGGTWAAGPDSNAHGMTQRAGVMGCVASGRALFFNGLSINNTADGSAINVATHEAYNISAGEWATAIEPLAFYNSVLANRGIVFVRTDALLQRVVLPSSNYTASTMAAALPLEGGMASVYRTSRTRVSSVMSDGSIRQIASSRSTPVPVTGTDATDTGVATISSRSAIGTPHQFQPYRVGEHQASLVLERRLGLYDYRPSGASYITALRHISGGANPLHWRGSWSSPESDSSVLQYGNHLGFHQVDEFLTSGDRYALTTTTRPRGLGAGSEVLMHCPFAINSRDTLELAVDNSTFSVPMQRKCTPVTSTTYGAQITVRDASVSSSLGASFGLGYSFDGHLVSMRSRVKSHSADASRRILWRFWRHGAEGDNAVMRYVYPKSASASIAVTSSYQQLDVTDNLGGQAKVIINVSLDSGAAKSASTLGNNLMALARTNPIGGVWDVYMMLGFSVIEAERTSAGGLTRLRIQVPNTGSVALGPQGSGITAGMTLSYKAQTSASNTLFSGTFVVNSVSAFNSGTGTQDIFVSPNTLHDGTSTWPLTANPGTLSVNPDGIEPSWDLSVVPGDLVRIEGNVIDPYFRDSTMRVVSASKFALICRALNMSVSGPITSPVWAPIGDPAAIKIFGGPTSNATAIAAAINALSNCPLKATVTGSGSGTISLASWDESNNESACYYLTDGVNYVAETIQPPSILSETSIRLMHSVSSDLQTDADWQNEEVYVIPVSASNVAKWIMSPTISAIGLIASVDVGVDQRIQVRSLGTGAVTSVACLGGSANTATAAVRGGVRTITRLGSPQRDSFSVLVNAAEASGFSGGELVRIRNERTSAKARYWTDPTVVVSTDVVGLWTISNNPYGLLSSNDEMNVDIEVVGSFTAIRIGKTTNTTLPSLTAFPEGGYIYLTVPYQNRSKYPAIASANRGAFRIVRSVDGNNALTIWIENNNAVNQTAVAKIKSLTPDSLVAGDKLVISTPRFGASNQGEWTITEVGAVSPGDEQYSAPCFRVDTSVSATEVVSGVVMGPDAALIQPIEGLPLVSYKEILSVVPQEGAFSEIGFTSDGSYDKIGEAQGSVIESVNKMHFPLGLVSGADGYRHHTGLIQEANRVAYGDESDPSSYPGYIAAGADLTVTGPLIRRIRISLAIRVNSGSTVVDLTERVKSAVAGFINQSPIGAPIPISGVVSAAALVPGIVAVSVVAPQYSSTADIIAISATEKAMIISLDDVLVDQVG